MANTVELRIYPDPSSPPPITHVIPWYAGLTALPAMVTGEAMNPKKFSFRVEYRSIYGAQIACIDGLADGDKAGHYWLFFVDGKESQVGASEAIIFEDAAKTTALIEWKYIDLSSTPSPTKDLKTKAL
jgi:hypothetical protein